MKLPWTSDFGHRFFNDRDYRCAEYTAGELRMFVWGMGYDSSEDFLEALYNGSVD